MIRSLAIKVNLLIALILVVALGMSSYANNKNLEHQAVHGAETEAAILTATIVNSIIVEMSGFCQKDVQKIVANFAAIPEIETAHIFDEDGIIMYSADIDEVGHAVNELDYSVFKSEEKERPFKSEVGPYRVFCKIEPIENRPECQGCHGKEKELLGVLDVCVSMTETEKRLAASTKFIYASTATTIFLVVFAISISLWVLVNVPVKRLVNTMTRAQKGDLSARAKVRGRDELGRLAGSFNSMLKQLGKSEQELKKFHAEQLRRADRLATIGELAAGLAHEIKNPLAGIAGATQVLAKEFDESDPRWPVTQEILKLIERLDSTIKDLLDFARTSVPEIVSADLPDILKKTMFLVEGMPEKKELGINVEINIDKDIPLIPADPDLIRHAFLNMAVNAMQAMSDGGTLIISMKKSADPDLGEIHPAEDYVMISFADDGSGIEEERLRSIFTPFHTSKTKGTGLGLSITQRIIEQHGGGITVNSVLGEGTVFRIYLPKESAFIPDDDEDADT
ncbi:MAG: ATP-binding protein [bacterium]